MIPYFTGVHDEVLTAAAEYPTSEMLTSRGLPIRDPDTGALYVQTQLLQVYMNLVATFFLN